MSNYDYCYCDYDSPTMLMESKPVARISHKCGECGRAIHPGDQYESVFGIWSGDASTHKTCARCVAAREFIKAHVPCFCWAYGDMLNDLRETVIAYRHEAPGLMFGTLRRYLKSRNRLETA